MIIPENCRIWRRHWIKKILQVSDWINFYEIDLFALSHVPQTIVRHNLSLQVDFIFQSFLVINMFIFPLSVCCISGIFVPNKPLAANLGLPPPPQIKPQTFISYFLNCLPRVSIRERAQFPGRTWIIFQNLAPSTIRGHFS